MQADAIDQAARLIERVVTNKALTTYVGGAIVMASQQEPK